jgi:hypothetical protein
MRGVKTFYRSNMKDCLGLPLQKKTVGTSTVKYESIFNAWG